VNWRCAYLRQRRKCRETGKPILQLDETWVDPSLTFRKCRQNMQTVGIAANVNAPNTHVVARLCGARGLIQGRESVHKVGKVTVYYHGTNEL
jgi:hypothetical protein